jgi:signal transduction histidine kinase
MSWHFTPFVLIYFVAATVSAFVVLIARRRRTVPGAQALASLMVAVTIWALCDGLESALLELPAKVFVSKLSHIGIQAISPLMLLFVLGYTQRQHWMTPRRMAALFIVPTITLLLVFTNESHRLIWQSTKPVNLPTGVELSFVHGPAFWAATVYHYIVITIGALLLLETLARKRDLYRKQAAVLVVAVFVPWIANIVYLTDINPLPGLDWTSLGFVATGVLVAYAIFVLRLFDLVPVAHNLLVERMSDALLVTDAQNRVVDANPAARHLLAEQAGGGANLFGQPVERLLGDTAADYLVNSLEEVHSVIHLQNEVLHGLDALSTPLLDGKGRINGRLIVLRDISERLRMEEELRRSEEHYRSFLAMVSHELRTPLTGILGMTEAMQSHVYGPLTERQMRSLRMIEQSGRHLSGVINDMLDLSRIQSGTLDLRYGVTTVGDLCEAAVAAAADEAERKGQLVSVEIDDPERLISVDVRRMEQVMINLMNNAVKFTPAEGRVGITAGLAPGGDSLYFRVWDTGIGIEPEKLEQLFQPFTQADERLSRAYGGAGLGLALVRRLVNMHGGAVDADSTPGAGSVFTVHLPYSEPAA